MPTCGEVSVEMCGECFASQTVSRATLYDGSSDVLTEQMAWLLYQKVLCPAPTNEIR